jgi:uncharacterized protein (DUF1800 family)
MADLTPVPGWTVEDVQHFARRAGFGISPEDAAALVARSPADAIDAWVDGTGADLGPFTAALAHADPVDEPQRGSAPDVAPAVPGPHPYLVEGADAWRNDLARAQAYLAFRMQYGPHPMQERLALFWHNLFATGWQKVASVALMLQQMQTLRAMGLARFDDLHAAVSKDPAMCIWLDSVLNRADGSNVPNENYAREALELYSLGADNGYNQQDITELARALSGWSFTVAATDAVPDPTDPGRRVAARGTFRVYDGSASSGEYLWNALGAAAPPQQLPSRHGTGTVTFLPPGPTFDIGVAPAGMAKGEDVLRSIIRSRPQQAAGFLARRLVLHFVTGAASQADLDQVAGLILDAGFDLRAAVKALLKSGWFFDPANRHALVEGPVSWTVRAARALGYDLASADSGSAASNRFPAWALVAGTFDFAGMRLLDPAGPNGWKEDVGWLNSNTIRYRAKLAAALALGETFSQGGGPRALFPTDVQRWFPTAPASPQAVLDRLKALLQPAPIPDAVQADWLSRLWPASAYTWPWDAAAEVKVRELAFLVLCSPSSQLY